MVIILLKKNLNKFGNVIYFTYICSVIKNKRIMKHRKWFLIKVIYDILSQEMVEFVDIKKRAFSMMVQLGYRAFVVTLNRVFLPIVTTPTIGEYSLLLNITNDDGDNEQHEYFAEDFDEETLERIAQAVYEETWTPAYKTWEEYLAWETEKYKNIF